MIYLDNAATTQRKPPQVAEAVAAAMNTLGNSARGAHRGALDAAHTIFAAREKLAALFGCPRADHVVFTGNVTEALNIALFGLAEEGDRVVSTVLDKIIIVGKVNKIVGALFSIFKYALLLGAVVWAMMASKMFPDGTLDTSFMAVMLKSFSEAFYTSFMNAL